MDQLYTYKLKFQEDGAGAGKTLEFSASDASEALLVASKEAPDRTVELWQGDQRLCRLERTKEDVWLVGQTDQARGASVH